MSSPAHLLTVDTVDTLFVNICSKINTKIANLQMSVKTIDTLLQKSHTEGSARTLYSYRMEHDLSSQDYSYELDMILWTRLITFHEHRFVFAFDLDKKQFKLVLFRPKADIPGDYETFTKLSPPTLDGYFEFIHSMLSRMQCEKDDSLGVVWSLVRPRYLILDSLHEEIDYYDDV
jgi:hypothetical protein